VTGASRGLGRAIVEAFAAASCWFTLDAVVLVSRSECCPDPMFGTTNSSNNNSNNDSNTGAAFTDAAAAAAPSMAPPAVAVATSVHKVRADLSDLSRLDAAIDEILKPLQQQQQSSEGSELIFINNAGSLGHIGPAVVRDATAVSSLPSPPPLSLEGMQTAVDLNVTSSLWLSTRVAQFAANRHAQRQKPLFAPTTTTATTTIVNISSLVAVQPFPTLALYSAGKAARDSYHQALAKEHDNNNGSGRGGPIIKFLNYAPGPLETEMTTEIRNCEQLDDALKPHYSKELVDPSDSAKALVRLLYRGTFESGQHVDYYDLLDDDETTPC
jgi:sepiapterin reductase